MCHLGEQAVLFLKRNKIKARGSWLITGSSGHLVVSMTPWVYSYLSSLFLTFTFFDQNATAPSSFFFFWAKLGLFSFLIHTSNQKKGVFTFTLITTPFGFILHFWFFWWVSETLDLSSFYYIFSFVGYDWMCLVGFMWWDSIFYCFVRWSWFKLLVINFCKEGCFWISIIVSCIGVNCYCLMLYICVCIYC